VDIALGKTMSMLASNEVKKAQSTSQFEPAGVSPMEFGIIGGGFAPLF
jgi:hypothetical protein